MPPIIAIIDTAFGDATAEASAVSRLGIHVEYRPDIGTDSSFFADPDVQAVLVRRRRLAGVDFDGMGNVRVVGRYGAGTDNIDLDQATDHGIAVVNVPDYCAEEVGQHALALILSSWRRLHASAQYDESDDWPRQRELHGIRPLSECVLGVVGAGRTGRELIRQAAPLFDRIVAWDPHNPPGKGAASAESLMHLLNSSDVVSLHCPLNDETRGMFDATAFAAMRPGSLLVNVARGHIIDAQALLNALDRNTPALAALDTIGSQPPEVIKQLKAHPSVVTTPHMAWYSARSIQLLRARTAIACADHLVFET